MGRQLLPLAESVFAQSGVSVPSVSTAQQHTTQRHTVQQPKVTLAISVPKRIVKRAVWRNYAKRVAREAWRSLPEPFVQHIAAPYFVLLRLRQLPTSQMVGGIAGARAVKKQLRIECDQVFGRLLRNH